MKRYILLLPLLVLPLSLLSQSQYDLRDSNNVNKAIKSEVQDSLFKIKKELDECQSLLRQRDSIIRELEKEKESLKEREDRVDHLIVRVMNARLQSQFNEKNVNEAIADYHTIVSPEKKEKYRYRESLLRKYGDYYDEIKSFIVSIQQDSLRIHKVRTEEYKKKCKEGLVKLSYYKYYKSDDRKYKIPYLDYIISLTEKELSKHGKKNAISGKVYLSTFDYILEILTITYTKI